MFALRPNFHSPSTTERRCLVWLPQLSLHVHVFGKVSYSGLNGFFFFRCQFHTSCQVDNVTIVSNFQCLDPKQKQASTIKEVQGKMWCDVATSHHKNSSLKESQKSFFTAVVLFLQRFITPQFLNLLTMMIKWVYTNVLVCDRFWFWFWFLVWFKRKQIANSLLWIFFQNWNQNRPQNPV